MAQVVDCYNAEAGGSSTMYYYRYPDNTSQATRIYTGEAIYLAADYLESMVGSMYRMVDPEGWIQWYHVRNIQPVYRTVTDVCSAPERVSINPETKILTITGGAGGDLNAWTGFGVSCRTRAISTADWGEWSGDVITSGRTVSVSAESGTVRQYRVRTLGEAGSEYYSPYTVCETLLSGNAAAGTPVILLPVSGADTYASVCTAVIQCPPEPDGDAMTLQRSLDGGAWTDVAEVDSAGGTVYDALSVEVGAHVLRYRLMDANGESGGEDGISFARIALAWSREINQYDIIANQELSFVKDIQQMMTCINQARAFYGKAQIALPGTPGYLADWHKQMLAMQNALDSCRKATGRETYGFELPTGWPKAYRINQLRAAIENT